MGYLAKLRVWRGDIALGLLARSALNYSILILAPATTLRNLASSLFTTSVNSADVLPIMVKPSVVNRSLTSLASSACSAARARADHHRRGRAPAGRGRPDPGPAGMRAWGAG